MSTHLSIKFKIGIILPLNNYINRYVNASIKRKRLCDVTNEPAFSLSMARASSEGGCVVASGR